MLNSRKRKIIVLSMAMGGVILLPLTTVAQYREDRFGLQEWYQTSLLGKQGGGNRRILLDPTCGGYNLYNQQFGAETYGGYELYNQTFGQYVPLGNGWLILASAGVGYALRKRKNNKNQQS